VRIEEWYVMSRPLAENLFFTGLLRMGKRKAEGDNPGSGSAAAPDIGSQVPPSCASRGREMACCGAGSGTLLRSCCADHIHRCTPRASHARTLTSSRLCLAGNGRWPAGHRVAGRGQEAARRVRRRHQAVVLRGHHPDRGSPATQSRAACAHPGGKPITGCWEGCGGKVRRV
jgi:hypothetical protein